MIIKYFLNIIVIFEFRIEILAQESSTTSTSIAITTLSTNQITSPFWIQTGCNISVLVDVSASQYQSDMELRLSNAYAVALNPSSVSKRRKRATKNGGNILQLVKINRIPSGSVASLLIYYVKTTSNTFVQPSLVISNMNQLSRQQMSVILGVSVTTVATYYDSEIQNPAVDQKLWIIGSLFGSLAGVALIIWFVLILYSQCIKPSDEPLLDKFSINTENNNYFIDGTKSNNGSNLEVKPHVEKSRSIDHYSLNTIKVDRGVMTDEKEMDFDFKERFSNEIFSTNIYKMEEYIGTKETVRKNNEEYLSSSSINLTSKSKKDKKKLKSSKKKNVKKKDIKNLNDVPIKNTEIIHETIKQKNETLVESQKSTEKALLATPEILSPEISTLTKVDDVIVAGTFQEKKQINVKRNLLEVKPSNSSPDEVAKFEDLKPVPFVNNYDSIHVYPKYSEDIVLSDAWHQLFEFEEIDEYEKSPAKHNKIKSTSSNLRTLQPLPRQSIGINSEINKKDAVFQKNDSEVAIED